MGPVRGNGIGSVTATVTSSDYTLTTGSQDEGGRLGIAYRGIPYHGMSYHTTPRYAQPYRTTEYQADLRLTPVPGPTGGSPWAITKPSCQPYRDHFLLAGRSHYKYIAVFIQRGKKCPIVSPYICFEHAYLKVLPQCECIKRRADRNHFRATSKTTGPE